MAATIAPWEEEVLRDFVEKRIEAIRLSRRDVLDSTYDGLDCRTSTIDTTTIGTSS